MCIFKWQTILTRVSPPSQKTIYNFKLVVGHTTKHTKHGRSCDIEIWFNVTQYRASSVCRSDENAEEFTHTTLPSWMKGFSVSSADRIPDPVHNQTSGQSYVTQGRILPSTKHSIVLVRRRQCALPSNQGCREYGDPHGYGYRVGMGMIFHPTDPWGFYGDF